MEPTALGELIRRTCIAEAAAPKPGNVHPGAAFDDLTFSDFVRAADAASPELAMADNGVGRAIESAVTETIETTGTNVNLGICLLIAPMAAVADNDWPSIAPIVESLTVDDAIATYRAIQTAKPGGLGEVDVEDVATLPSVTLLQAMELAADRDGIAAIYRDHFRPIIDVGLPILLSHWRELRPPDAIVRTAVQWQSEYPDTHIARRCGAAEALEASQRASEVVADWSQLDEFDRWLRADGHRRNPGTTADVVAAILFAATRTDPKIDLDLKVWVDQLGLL